ncbi:MAG: hypothetical protein VW876_13575, partial [Deltaproteobacteria bacterium]
IDGIIFSIVNDNAPSILSEFEKELEFTEVAFFCRFILEGICSGITMMRRPSLFLIVTGVIFRLGF